MLRCRVLHTHMIVVVRQTERTPNVVRCFGCPIHRYGGLLGVVVLVVGLFIYFMGQYRQYVQQKGMGPTPVKSRGGFTRLRLRSGRLYASVLYALRFRYVEVHPGACQLLISNCRNLGFNMRALSAPVVRGGDCSGNRVFTRSCLRYIRCIL